MASSDDLVCRSASLAFRRSLDVSDAEDEGRGGKDLSTATDIGRGKAGGGGGAKRGCPGSGGDGKEIGWLTEGLALLVPGRERAGDGKTFDVGSCCEAEAAGSIAPGRVGLLCERDKPGGDLRLRVLLDCSVGICCVC
jgi:hypothetical protein